MFLRNTPYKVKAIALGMLACAACAQAEEASSTTEVGVTELSPVQVSGTRSSIYRPASTSSATLTEAPLVEIPVTVDVISRELMDSRDTDNIDDVMRFEAGVFDSGKSLFQRTPGKYSVRGMSGSDVQLGGLPLPAGMGTVLDASMLERVEVIKGPVGSVTGGQTSTMGAYGAGGSINLVMKEPQWENFANLELSGRIGNGQQRYRGALDYNQANESKDVAVRLNASTWTAKPFWLQGGADWETGFTVSPSVLWAPSDKAKVLLQVSYQYQDAPSYMGIPVFEGKYYSAYDASFGKNDGRSKYEGLLVQLSGEVKANSVWTFRGGASMGMSWLDYDAWGLISTPANYGSIVDTGLGEYEFGWADTHYTTYNIYGHSIAKFNTCEVAHEVLMGLDYTCRLQSGYSGGYGGVHAGGIKDVVNVWNLTQPLYGRGDSSRSESDLELHKAGIILQDMISWESWRLLAGGRMDTHFSDEGNDAFSVSPRVGLTKLFGEHVAVFGNFSMTESPNFGYEGLDGKELTDSWKAKQYEAGFRVNPVKDLWFTATAFRIEQTGTPTAIGVGSASYYASEGENRSTGVELALKGAVTKWWDSSFSYTHLHYKDITAGQTFDRYPPHSVSLWQTFKIPVGLAEDLRMSLGYRFSAEYFATFRGTKITTVPGQKKDYTIPTSHIFDFVCELPVPATDWTPACSVRLGVYNIFNERYVASLRHAAQCFVGEPRSFELGLKMSF